MAQYKTRWFDMVLALALTQQSSTENIFLTDREKPNLGDVYQWDF